MEGSEQIDKGNPTKLSGRKTRAQRKREKDAELGNGDAKERDIDEEQNDMEDFSAGLEIEDVESENMESEETEKEMEDSVKEDKVSRAQGKEKAKENSREDDELGNEADLTQNKSKRRGRKSQSVTSEKTLEEEEEQDLSEMAENGGKVKEGKRGRGRKSPAKEGTKRDAEQKEKSNDLEAVKELTANDVSVNNISIVSSNASSGSESSTKAGNGAGRKRRKRSRVLPPYAFKRRASKANSSKNSSAVSSQESMTETNRKRRRLQDEKNETYIAEKSSKRGATTNPRNTGRAKSTGKTSEGVRKSFAQGNEIEADSVVVEEVGANDSVQEATGVGDSSFEDVPEVIGSVAPAQPVTVLKSILKSGGSVGRPSTGIDSKYNLVFCVSTEHFAFEFCNTKTSVITVANQKGHI